ncbi:dTDP-4-dehydrorhamnose reductase [candidate division KSB1 bacterium]|nr:dTDP-4-dehydrorhamnose reductase [candidate division KSB1 bacterium]
MEKILITGCNGLLGQKCIQTFVSQKDDVLGCDLHDRAVLKEKSFRYVNLDLVDRTRVKEIVNKFKPMYIINTAAFTNVDACEIEREKCWKTNVEAVEHLIYAAKKVDAAIIQISTDYVFNGESGPYRESDTPNPLGYYGKSKLAAENLLIESGIKHAILRTMILYGCGVNIRLNFTTWIIKKLKNKENISVVTDQIGNPTLANDLAYMIRQVINKNKFDLYHASGKEIIDRYAFALKIADQFKLDKSLIHPIKSSELNQTAPRPLNSGFIIDKLETDLSTETLTIKESLTLFKKDYKKLKPAL